MSRLDWSSLPEDRATTMLKIYEVFGWPPGLLAVQRQLVARTLRRVRQNWRRWRHGRRRAGAAEWLSRHVRRHGMPAQLMRREEEWQT